MRSRTSSRPSGAQHRAKTANRSRTSAEQPQTPPGNSWARAGAILSFIRAWPKSWVLTDRQIALAAVAGVHLLMILGLLSYRIMIDAPVEGPSMRLYSMPKVNTQARPGSALPMQSVPFYLSEPSLPEAEKPPEPPPPPPLPPARVRQMAEGALTPAVAANTPRARGSDLISPPDYLAPRLRNRPPLYPPDARGAREEGVVTLRVMVDSTGRTAAVEVYQSSGSKRLDNAAAETVMQWRFVPAERGGQPITAWTLISFGFNLSSATAALLYSST